MAEAELRQLRLKLEEQQKQFENYREECKNLQNFLQAEANKKQAQVRKLKEEAINKDRMFKALKNDNTALLTEVANLKSELGKLNAGIEKNDNQAKQLQTLTKEYECLKEQHQKLNAQIEVLQQEKVERQKEVESYKEKVAQLQQQVKEKDSNIMGLQSKLSSYENEIKRQKGLIEQLQIRKVKLEDLPTSHKEIKDERFMTAKKSRKREESELPDERLKKYEEKLLRYERQIKQLKARLADQTASSPQKPLLLQEDTSKTSKVFMACQVMTKQFYLSPIAEINEESKCVRLFKSARNGCFDKSLGATKHKFDVLSHESSSIVKVITDRILKSEESNHSILIYGVKKSNKKQIMGAILTKLFNFLKNKVESESSVDLQAVFIKRTSDEQSGLSKQAAFNSQQILDILEKVANIANGDKPKSEKSSPRKTEKQRVCYFSLNVGDFAFEIATSSFTNIPYRQKEVLTTFYNNVLYSKLPNILQPAHCQRYIILTLNPIIDLYEDCKNTLSVTQYKGIISQSIDTQLNLEGINKEMLNEMVKNKMGIYQREIEQNLLKIKKVEDQCFYFKSKFDELQNRLKTLLSTHHGQNSYLKKSPILLSYEKMLKFVHAVQAKTPIPIDNICSTMRINPIDLDFNDSSDSDEAI